MNRLLPLSAVLAVAAPAVAQTSAPVYISCSNAKPTEQLRFSADAGPATLRIVNGKMDYWVSRLKIWHKMCDAMDECTLSAKGSRYEHEGISNVSSAKLTIDMRTKRFTYHSVLDVGDGPTKNDQTGTCRLTNAPS